MQFNMPRKIEKTLLEELCEQYGATLNTFEWALLNNMPADKIEVILRFELTKALMTARHKVATYLGRINKLDKQYHAVETTGNDEACMKLLADLDYLHRAVSQTEDLIKYLKTLG